MCKETENRKPLIHCLTNPIAMNQSANTVLALGARPIMAEHPMEVEEITETADALLLNLGNISDNRIEAMKKSIKVANALEIPVVLDGVGVACSSFRRAFIKELLAVGKVSVIKGNYSEIIALYDENYKSSGVDAVAHIETKKIETAILQVAQKYNCVVLATGAADFIGFSGVVSRAIGDREQTLWDKKRVEGGCKQLSGGIKKVEGGCKQLSTVTGTGCMLGAIIATFLAFDNSEVSVEKACKFFKSCGEKAQTDKGPGTFMVNLLDELHKNPFERLLLEGGAN
ncbi:hydroxyethylthiazole kinase [Pseudobutyrivibrio sp. YE44]|uniref:hydroxyethylthiazole kinase n=1 Tax=Pseudobutyrivibrio sp. YE44 TaxID=1520802 RepID=UPI0008846DBB|nr:hydroxyethylthiazole kinase [Pseudobutyrivibrio sp. YE44]SDB24295.1 hydroxyethylthiazole kinase [Pseudobutyrivibrio sp. YE44]